MSGNNNTPYAIKRVSQKILCKIVAVGRKFRCDNCLKFVRTSPHACKFHDGLLSYVDVNLRKKISNELAKQILDTGRYKLIVNRIPYITKRQININYLFSNFGYSNKGYIQLSEDMFCRNTFETEIFETDGRILLFGSDISKEAVLNNRAYVIISWNERNMDGFWNPRFE